jgi:hypothetical protein
MPLGTEARARGRGGLLEEAVLSEPANSTSLAGVLVEETEELGRLGERTEGLSILGKLSDPSPQRPRLNRKRLAGS